MRRRDSRPPPHAMTRWRRSSESSSRRLGRGHGGSTGPALLAAWYCAVLFLPPASPFGVVVGSSSSAAGRGRHHHPGAAAGGLPPPPSSAAASALRSGASAAGRARAGGTVLVQQNADASAAAAEANPPTKINGDASKGKRALADYSHDWRDNELNATLLSRVTYGYVEPLLLTSEERTLDAADAFTVPSDDIMGGAVPRLQRIYDQCRARSLRRLEGIKAEEAGRDDDDALERHADDGMGNTRNLRRNRRRRRRSKRDRLATSKSLTLAKALLLSQRRTLAKTAILRLVNTCVQAFPAILVSRLLRLIEAGETVHPLRAFRAALLLVGVLSLKMLLENAYFHGVVRMATQVRGSLAGIIFDKSLRLSSGSYQSAGGGASPSSEDGEKKQQQAALGAGGVLNLMQSDTSIIENAALLLHTSWDGILQISIYSYLLFRYLGPSVLWGMAVLLTTIPLNSATLRILNRLSRVENEAKDARTRSTAEAISNMKLLKLQGWEYYFANGIHGYRAEELRRHVSRGVVRALNQAVSNAVPAITLVVTLAAYSRTGRPVVASTIFTAISLFNQLRFPLFFYPMLVDSLANGKNAVRRVSRYLTGEEIVPYVRRMPLLEEEGGRVGGGGGRIEMRNGNFLWSAVAQSSSSSSSSTADTTASATEATALPEEEDGATPSQQTTSDEESSRPVAGAPALCGASLIVEPGEIVAVVGPVGSGKTALIKGLLGELAPVPRAVVDDSYGGGSLPAAANSTDHHDAHGAAGGSGIMDFPSVTTRGDVAYCAQESWLPKGTLRDAVVFGREYDEVRYRSAIRDAGLDRDIVDDDGAGGEGKGGGSKVFGGAAADSKQSKADASRGVLSHETDVGEGGSSLSGGQRARVALARALYGGSSNSGGSGTSTSGTAGVYLLDDPLAALDASVGSLVFERLTARLRDSKAATVLVTNDPSLPRRCDRVVLMGQPAYSRGGGKPCPRIVDVGTYDELVSRGHDLRSIGVDHGHDLDDDDDDGVDSTNGEGIVDSKKEPSTTPRISSKARRKEVEVIGLDEPKTNIRIVSALNDTSAAMIQSCHADPDCRVVMKQDPEYLAERVVPRASEVHVEVEEIQIRRPRPSASSELSSASSASSSARGDDSSAAAEEDERGEESPAPSAAAEEVPPATEQVDKKKTKKQTKAEAKKAAKAKKAKAGAPLSADDAMTTGAVPLSTYVLYLKSVRSPALLAGMVGSYLLANAAQFFQQFTIAKWTELSTGGVGATAAAAALGTKYLRSLVYAAGVVSVFLWLRSFLTMKVGVRASEHLHSNMLTSVFKAPISFFDATPSGQLLSRFGKELETVDRALPDGIGSVLFCFLQLAFSSFALASVVTPVMVLPLLTIAIFYTKTMGRFRPAARDLKRSESKSRSPIYTHFGEALRGAETIRSVRGGRALWSSGHRTKMDENLSVFYSVKALDRWLSVRLETLGNCAVLATAVSSIVLTRAGTLKSGNAGWGITQALSITGLLAWAVRCLTDLETQMMSVMRVAELTDLESTSMMPLPTKDDVAARSEMPKELAETGAALDGLFSAKVGAGDTGTAGEKTSSSSTKTMRYAPPSDAALAASGWPWRGGVRFKNASMRYNPTQPLVLKNVSIDVPPGTTLGVVGRTGSGKSSLLLTLFRLVEIEKRGGESGGKGGGGNGGSIEIDGVDIRAVSLKTLRESISIIPQDPVLFAGTVLYNLDATGKASEAEAWRALESASPDLAAQFRNNGRGLQTDIAEGGKNLSLGQRQLICLARALMRRAKILVLDEATSAVDSKTDAQVQETIRREFVRRGVTVITVAHRLDTVLGYDAIAVLGDGELIEYGAPSELLKDRGGYLRMLVNADIKNKKLGGAPVVEREQPVPIA